MIRTLLVAALLLLAGCTSDTVAPPAPSAPKIEVDTPKLRALKDEIAMADCERVEGQPVDGGLPPLTLPCLGGGPDVDLAGLRGPLVINIWQSYCQPCIKEMPAIEEFYQAHGEQVAVLGIDHNDVRPEAALLLAKRTGATYPSVADPGADLSGAGDFPVIRGVPMFVLVAADGTIAHMQSGGVDDVAEIEKMVEEHLGVTLR